MMEKEILNLAFQKLKGGCFSVRYWDDEEVVYGQGHPDFQCYFNEKPSLKAMAADPILAIGEMHMEGIVDFNGDLEAMFQLVHRNPPDAGLGGRVVSAAGKGLALLKSTARQKENIKAHYDLGNDFFSLWLDDTMSYSCAYFKNENDSLKKAQQHKTELVLKKMRLQSGQKILDIGCGWGELSLRAAEQYGVKALGITLSEEQYAKMRQRISEAGLEGDVEARLINYLDLSEPEGSFDRVISVGMFEHVGQACFRDYFKKVAALLKPGGLTMLHTLTSLTEKATNTWVKKYIFPGGYIPSLREVVALLPEFGFHVLHIESLRRHYAKTLEMWRNNFSKPEVREKVLKMFDEKFIRMWSLYLLGAGSSLKGGSLDVHQLVLSKGPNNELPMTLEDIYG